MIINSSAGHMNHDYAIFTSKTVIVRVGLHYLLAAAWSPVA